MSDASREPAPAKPQPARPDGTAAASGSLPSARPVQGGRQAEPGRRDARRGGRGRGGRRRGKPTPVRETLGPTGAPAPQVEPDAESVTLHAGEEEWRVRVRGRSVGGGATPLLLLGFERAAGGSDEESSARILEALVVGRSLSRLTEGALLAALESAHAPPDPERRAPFFPEAGEGKRR